MALPHEVYTPPGEDPKPRSSMSMRRIKKLPYVESGVPVRGLAARNKLGEAKVSGLYDAMAAGDRHTVPPIHVDTLDNISFDYGGMGGSGTRRPNAKLAIGNGGHRVAAAEHLGWKRININSDVKDTGTDWGDQSRYTQHGAPAPHQVLSASQFTPTTPETRPRGFST